MCDILDCTQVTENAPDNLGEAGALARAAGAPDALIAAALLHDVGHLLNASDARHGTAGADWLAAWLPPVVTEPVRLHVPAKRYLCFAGPGPYGADAVAVRRWDDQAKDPAVTPPPFGSFATVLASLTVSTGR